MLGNGQFTTLMTFLTRPRSLAVLRRNIEEASEVFDIAARFEAAAELEILSNADELDRESRDNFHLKTLTSLQHHNRWSARVWWLGRVHSERIPCPPSAHCVHVNNELINELSRRPMRTAH